MIRQTRRRLHPTTWLAAFALLAMALLPGLARALSTDIGWTQVCTAMGMRYVVVDTDGADHDERPDSVSSAAHCPWCKLEAWGGVLPDAPASTCPPCPSSEPPTARAHDPTAGARMLRLAQPRAPPSADA